MRKLFVMMMLVMFSQVSLAAIEGDIIQCRSGIEGFKSFIVTQVADFVGSEIQSTFYLKVGQTPDIWNQLGNAQLSYTGVGPMFKGQFFKSYQPPVDPNNPAQPGQPTWEERKQYIYVSINTSGNGTISVHSDLAPISCQRL